MRTALGFLLIALAAGDASAEPYRPLPRLTPGKVKSRGEARKVPIPPVAARAAPPAAASPPLAAAMEPATPPPRASARRARRVGPPPPLQDEFGRTIVFAAAPPLQDEVGRVIEADDPVHVIVLPVHEKRRRGPGK
jgi:hypothetical protein